MKEFDEVTSFIKMSTDILFVKNPVSTSMGVFFGIVLHGLISLLAPFFAIFEGIRSSTLTIFHFVALGVFGFNFPNYVNRHKIKPELEEAIALIERQVSEGKLTKADAKHQYRLLISKAVEDARGSEPQQNLSRTQG
ncbi:hypothetical protein ACK34T_05985 [Aeromonas veronii]